MDGWINCNTSIFAASDKMLALLAVASLAARQPEQTFVIVTGAHSSIALEAVGRLAARPAGVVWLGSCSEAMHERIM